MSDRERIARCVIGSLLRDGKDLFGRIDPTTESEWHRDKHDSAPLDRTKPSGLGVFELVTTDVPAPARGEVTIAVHAAGVKVGQFDGSGNCISLT